LVSPVNFISEVKDFSPLHQPFLSKFGARPYLSRGDTRLVLALPHSPTYYDPF
jgi:hypothetical protein